MKKENKIINKNTIWSYTNKVLKDFKNDYNNNTITTNSLFTKYKDIFHFTTIKELNEFAKKNIKIIDYELTEEEKKNIKEISLFMRKLNEELIK
jgi:hypothetical protein